MPKNNSWYTNYQAIGQRPEMGLAFSTYVHQSHHSSDQEMRRTILVVGSLDVGITGHAKEFRRIRHLI
ncbi:hypothetical protein SAMN00768000_2503 [Sulfobacillus thermosulfidooxidans DSM 9293]|uniref:Uncharacterized protein n=1 Tax=Sulfobacillus thermosulfidooxidans (strain DSM 9293 / VKM B-1269 / AT-1) TaxID=929705 RepID=A0A1W1WIL0_SULTA|nr:hypothetical protein SAMN00768000_2503 [Sulfobacillus thermosulfidooxidans DSM 9293]